MDRSSPHRTWLGFAPLALLLAVLLGGAAPGSVGAPERGIGAGHRAAAPGARIARPAAAPGAIVAAAQAGASASARPHGTPAALVAGDAAFALGWLASAPVAQPASRAPASRARLYDPRGPPSTPG
jgi:hypothetical protein